MNPISFARSASLVPALLCCSAVMAADAGFGGLTEFEAVELQGSVLVTCPGRSTQENRSYRCYGETLLPAELAHFTHDGGVQADRVELVARHADGSSRKSARKFDAGRGRSQQPFNLWLSSLIQRPLLKLGVNAIRYTMKAGAETVEQGEFEVDVKEGAGRECAFRHYSSSNPQDCRSSANVCARYFAEGGNCSD
jgi:hypothetical protein